MRRHFSRPLVASLMRFRSSGLPNPLLPAAARLYSLGCGDALLPSLDPKDETNWNLVGERDASRCTLILCSPVMLISQQNTDYLHSFML